MDQVASGLSPRLLKPLAEMSTGACERPQQTEQVLGQAFSPRSYGAHRDRIACTTAVNVMDVHVPRVHNRLRLVTDSDWPWSGQRKGVSNNRYSLGSLDECDA